MNGEDLLRAMSQVDERYVQEAETVQFTKPKSAWMRWTALAAACLAVVLGVGLAMGGQSAENLSMENAPAGMDRFPAGKDAAIADQETMPCSEETDLQDEVYNEAPQEPALVPETVVPEPDQVPGSPAEVPSVLLRIDAWQENGFEATVEGTVDTDIYPVGAKLTVKFQKNIRIVELNGDLVSCTRRTPTQEDFPAGSVVQILFSVEDDGVLLVEQIGKEDAF